MIYLSKYFIIFWYIKVNNFLLIIVQGFTVELVSKIKFILLIFSEKVVKDMLTELRRMNDEFLLNGEILNCFMKNCPFL